jgi:hypothetical protein
MKQVRMHRPGAVNVIEIPAEQQQMYQSLGFVYQGPVPEPAPQSKATKRPKSKE